MWFSKSIVMQWKGNNLQRNTPYSSMPVEKALIDARFYFLRIATIMFEVVTALAFVKMLRDKYGRECVARVIKKLPSVEKTNESK